ncbi:MAG TPA: GGDEF domain-containing protein [Clostridium sp.]|jgi:diguanylate cyclase (GGDEF)-like protein/PAS domain S-box-containing protein|nr:GGDEF domain-containing protein [Clostridium sp.]
MIAYIISLFNYSQENRFFIYLCLGLLISSMLFIAILLFYIRKIKNMKKELESNHEELTELYEELAKNDDELRVQYDELSSTQNFLTSSEERYRLVLESTNDAIWDVDVKTYTVFFSDKWYELLGYKEEDFNGYLITWRKYAHPDDLPKIVKILRDNISGKTSFLKCEFRIKTAQGDYKWIRTRGKTLFNSQGEAYRIIGSHMDITELKYYEAELEYIAYHDSLTGLYNRLYMYETIGTRLKKIEENTSRKIVDAMLFMDIDNLKFINDTLGHSFGDKFILEIAMRLLSLTNNNCELFRLNGDEFIFYIKNVSGKEEIESFASKVIDCFNQTLSIDGHVISASVSIGISLYPIDGKDVDTLLRFADMAMYKVKQKGKNGYCFFNTLIKEEIQARVNIERHLKKALDNDEFILHYQPQIDVETKNIIGFESLVRWLSPDMGLVPPLKFIHIAEETGFIVPLGEWILRTSCQFCKNINRERNTNYKISVNISVMQLLQDNFNDMVERALKDTGLSANLLELEITESIIMESPELIVGKLKQLRQKGISVALDDFGTGYSSLAYLKNIPITTLKIDKLFIDDISSDDSNTTLTDSIISLGHKIGLTIVAEGVETTDQLKYLENNKCDMIQGYLFSKPLPPEDISKLLN